MIKVEDYKIFFSSGFLTIPNLEIANRCITLIVGDNGTGKTTFIRSILRINTEYTGKIFIDGIENFKLKRKEISKFISYLPQTENAVFSIYVEDFIKQSMYYVKENYFDEVIKILNLTNYLKRDYKCLSGGERQLIKIARSMVPDVPYTILDEPDTFLSRKNKEKLRFLLEHFSKKRGIIVVSHSRDVFANVKNIIDFEDYFKMEAENE